MDFATLAQQCAPSVAPETMAAIVKTESGLKPLAIGVNGGALERQPATKDEAVVTAKWLIANGYNIDIGLGQVNSANLARVGLTVEVAFDACRNLAASAQILTANYLAIRSKLGDGQRALHAAISTYNTGSTTRGLANGYVQRVIANGNAWRDLAAPVVPSILPVPLAVTRRFTPLLSTLSPADALTRKTKAAALRVTAQDDDESETVKLVADAPGRSSNPAVARSGVSVYDRDAEAAEVYR